MSIVHPGPMGNQWQQPIGSAATGGTYPWDPLQWSHFCDWLGFSDAWDDTFHKTEQDRYASILAHLAEDNVRKGTAQRELVRDKETWALLKRRSRTNLWPHTEKVDKLMRLADQVQMEWAEDSSKQIRFHQLNSHPLVHQLDRKTVHVRRSGRNSATPVCVENMASNTRYYFGRKGGDHIIQYRDRVQADDLEAILTSNNAEGIPQRVTPLTHTFRGLDGEMKAFTYSGQVPRPQQEYLARLRVLVPAVVQMAVCLIGYHRHCQNDYSLIPELRRLGGVGVGASFEQHLELLDLWMREFPNGEPPCRLQELLCSSSNVTELAQVLANVVAIGGGGIQLGLRPVTTVLEKGTGMSLEQLSNMETIRASDRAFDEMLNRGCLDHVVVLETFYLQDVHRFFLDSRFEIDTAHPHRRYVSLDVRQQLEHSRWLQRSGWDDVEEPDLTSSDDTDSGEAALLYFPAECHESGDSTPDFDSQGVPVAKPSIEPVTPRPAESGAPDAPKPGPWDATWPGDFEFPE